MPQKNKQVDRQTNKQTHRKGRQTLLRKSLKGNTFQPYIWYKTTIFSQRKSLVGTELGFSEDTCWLNFGNFFIKTWNSFSLCQVC